MQIGRLHVLTDYHFQQRYSHAELARLAIEGGADTIQFRQKTGPIRHRLVDARRAATVCGENEIPLLIDDLIDITLAVGAEGVHLGQDDFPVDAARSILGPERIIGATATTLDQALRAQKLGANYIGFGPVYPTRSKDNPAPVKGLEGLAAVCRAVDLPVIAIAGMTPSRSRQAIYAGAHGVAVMTGISLADNPCVATRRYRKEIDLALAKRSL